MEIINYMLDDISKKKSSKCGRQSANFACCATLAIDSWDK
jgi:hypothetical protein